MAIPKKIHYCWFGGNPLPDEAKKCIRSWKRHCPDYEIIQWDEGNFDVNCNAYCRQAYENKKWAFVTDYARLWILYHYGGVYFDTDVKVIKSFDKFLKHPCFVGIEKSKLYVNVNTGVGMGAEQGNEVVKALLNSYENIPFIVNGKQDITTCTVRNTEVLKQFGYQHEDAFQQLEYQINGGHNSHAQVPFVTLGFGLGESKWSRLVQKWILKTRIKGLGKERKTAIFPKLVFALKRGLNLKPQDPNYDMKELALECSSKRMYPDILSYDKVVEVTGGFKNPMGEL